MHRFLADHPGLAMRQMGVGEAVVSPEPLGVGTVLGSCVAVTFHCPVSRYGGVFHALMPCRGTNEKAGDNCYKYVDSAIHEVLGELYRHGVQRRNLVCKVFGGANAMFDEQFGVGRRNVTTAFETLEAERLRVAAADVGGDRGRKLVFLTHTGEVFVKRLAPRQSRG